jgi:hypothetical protein
MKFFGVSLNVHVIGFHLEPCSINEVHVDNVKPFCEEFCLFCGIVVCSIPLLIEIVCSNVFCHNEMDGVVGDVFEGCDGQKGEKNK